MTACPNCRRHHDPVSRAEWTWRVRDTKPKPPGSGLAVLWMLASRMDPATGCGFASVRDLADLTGVSDDTVGRATGWALERFLLRRARRGHRVKDGAYPATEWQLQLPEPNPHGRGLGEPKPAEEPTQTGRREAQVRPSQDTRWRAFRPPGFTNVR